MFLAIGKWLIGTRLGQTVALAAAITAAVFATYCYVTVTAYNRGVADEAARWNKYNVDALTGEINKRAEQSQSASEIAARAGEDAEKASTTIDNQTNSDKDKDHEDFRAPPAAPAVGFVVAVPAGVQARLDAAVERAND